MYIYIYIRVAIITITLMITLLWTIMRPRCLPCNTVLTFLQHSIRLNGVTLHLLGSLATHPSLAMWKFSEYLSLSLYKKNPPKTADVAKDRLGRSTSFVIFRRKRRAAHSSVPFILEILQRKGRLSLWIAIQFYIKHDSSSRKKKRRNNRI